MKKRTEYHVWYDARIDQFMVIKIIFYNNFSAFKPRNRVPVVYLGEL